MIAGIVKNWDKLKGWGFIKGDDGIDYFLHISKIRTGQVVRENTQVKFDADYIQNNITVSSVLVPLTEIFFQQRKGEKRVCFMELISVDYENSKYLINLFFLQGWGRLWRM